MVLALAAVAIFAASDLTYRHTSLDLTPPELLPLGGYTARGSKTFEPGGDRLFARCILLEFGNQRLAVVSVEMLTVPESLVAAVRARIAPDLKLFLAATHTHCAPDSQMLNERMTLSIPGIASFQPRWLEWYADRIALCINQAERSSPTRADNLSATASHVDLNRGRRPGAQPDKMQVVVKAGEQVLFRWYSAHATFYDHDELKLRGDWPGAFDALTLVGAIGDVSPVAGGDSPEARIRNFAERADRATERGTRIPLEPRLDVLEVPLPLAQTGAHPDFARLNRIPPALADNIVGRFAPRSAQITIFRIGKLAIVGIPGEPTSEIGRHIRDQGRLAGFQFTLVVSHVNGWIGYILGPEDYDRGGYEATLSFHGREQGRTVAEQGVVGLRQIRGQRSTSAKSFTGIPAQSSR